VPPDGALPRSASERLGGRPFGCYVHVPFCATRCGYCDFNTYTAAELGGGSRDSYPGLVIAEIRLARRVLGGADLPVSSVFFGGGTPTLLPPSQLGAILRAIDGEFGLTRDAEVGEIFDGKVTRIMSIGAFVEYLPGKEGLVRVSEISNERVNRIEDVVKVGDPVKVKIAEVDRQGRVNLSIRAVTEENGNSYEERQRAERARYQDREGGGDRGGFRRGPGGGGGGFRPRSGPPRG